MNLRLSRSVTLVLTGACVLLFLLVVAFWFGMGRGYSWWTLDSVDEASGKKKLVNAQFRLEPWESFAEVNARPLFNEDRRPTPPMPPEQQGEIRAIPKLDVVLAGVILTSKVRLAMVKEKGKEKSTTVKEGGAMPGEFGAWSLIEVKPRSAVFKNSAGDSTTVELIAVANSQKPTPPPPPRVATPAPPAPGQMPQPGQPPQILPTPAMPANPDAAAAADLQQRIDARRQQIREQQQQQQQQVPQPDPHQPLPQQQ